MSNMLSPGVYPREIDRSFGTPAIADSVGAIVIDSNKGPTEITEISSRSRFIELYGEPTSDTPSKHAALRFLRDSNRLNVLRVINDAETASVDVIDSNLGDPVFTVNAANPGSWGNNVSVELRDRSDDDVFQIVVSYHGEVVESFDVSQNPDKKNGFGRAMYIEDVINNGSDYIRVEDDVSNDDEPVFGESYDLVGGSNDTSAVTDADIATGWDSFESTEQVSANILINAGWASTNVQNKMIEIAEYRKDCVAVLDIPQEDANDVDSMIEYANNELNANTSWAALYGPWIRVYDQYNDREVYLPPSGDAAGVYARTSNEAEAWDAPAGMRRGVLNVLGTQTSLDQGQRDALYEANINPVVNFTGEGVVIWGQKTLQAQASSLDRVNVRRLLIHIQNTLEPALKPFVFEGNTAFTRDNVASLVENFLEDIQARRGVTGFSVVVDESNNTSQVIDSNQLVVDLFIQPARSAEFIRLNTVLTPTGVSFN